MNEANFAPAEAANFHPVDVADPPKPAEIPLSPNARESNASLANAADDDITEGEIRPLAGGDTSLPKETTNNFTKEDVTEGDFTIDSDEAKPNQNNQDPNSQENIQQTTDPKKETQSDQNGETESDDDVVDSDGVREVTDEKEFQEKLECQKTRDYFRSKLKEEMAKEKPDEKMINTLNTLANMDDKQTREFINITKEYCSNKIGKETIERQSSEPKTEIVLEVAKELDRIEMKGIFPKERMDLVRDKILVLYLNPDNINKCPEDFITAKLLILLWLLAIAFDVGDKLVKESFKAMAPDIKSIPENQPQPLPIPVHEQAQARQAEQPTVTESPAVKTDDEPISLDPVSEVPELDKQVDRPELTADSIPQLDESEQSTVAELTREEPIQITQEATHPEKQVQSTIHQAEENKAPLEQVDISEADKQEVRPKLTGLQSPRIADTSTTSIDIQNQPQTDEEAAILAGPETTGDLFNKVTNAPEMAEAVSQSTTV